MKELHFNKETITDLIKETIKKFDEEQKYNESGLLKVIRCFGEHDMIDEVLIKVRLIDLIYSTRLVESSEKNIISVQEMAELIVKYEKESKVISKKIKEGNIEVVDLIGKTDEKHNNAYSFASKYCSWHNPDKFPIMDRYTRGVLYYWAKTTEIASYTQEIIKNYAKYKELVDVFKSYYNLDLNYKEIDKFLWKYGKDNNLAYD